VHEDLLPLEDGQEAADQEDPAEAPPRKLLLALELDPLSGSRPRRQLPAGGSDRGQGLVQTSDQL